MNHKIKHLVHIDDDKQILGAVKMLLEGQGYSVHTFSDPYEGRDYILSNAVDLVLCDIKMPGLDGFQIYQEFRSKFPDTPFVFYSGHFEFQQKVKSYSLDEKVFFLPKPSFDITDEIERFLQS